MAVDVTVENANHRRTWAFLRRESYSLRMVRRVLAASVVNHQRRLSRAGRDRGFTLVELAVVVTIVAVLAVIALVGYRKYMLNSKVTEAQSMISGIKIAQEDRKSEKGSYADVGSATLCPVGAGTSDKKWGWDPGCSGGGAKWSTLSVHVEGPVQFGYVTSAASNAAFTKPSGPDGVYDFVDWTKATAPSWYVIGAVCDLDNGGVKTQLVGSSFDNRIFSNNVGE